MGQLVNGEWIKGSISNNAKDGGFKRLNSVFRNNISEDHDTYRAESKRYHLYVSYACPWAHRTLIFRKLKKLDNHISVDFSHPDMLDMGWSFAKDFPKATGDTLYNKRYAHEIYQLSNNKISTKATVPIFEPVSLALMVTASAIDVVPLTVKVVIVSLEVKVRFFASALVAVTAAIVVVPEFVAASSFVAAAAVATSPVATILTAPFKPAVDVVAAPKSAALSEIL